MKELKIGDSVKPLLDTIEFYEYNMSFSFVDEILVDEGRDFNCNVALYFKPNYLKKFKLIVEDCPVYWDEIVHSKVLLIEKGWIKKFKTGY
jgi:hypothetical protein